MSITAAPGTAALRDDAQIVGWTDDGDPIRPEVAYADEATVPAQPGWRGILHAGFDEVDWWTLVLPIVAWRIVSSNFVVGRAWKRTVCPYPIMVNNDAALQDVPMILPDGTVLGEDSGDGFEHFKAWEEHAIQVWHRMRAIKR